MVAQADGTLLVGGKVGLKTLKDGKLVDVEDFKGVDVRGLANRDGVIWAAAKDGIWKREGTEWKNIKSGDFWAVTFEGGGSIIAAGKMGVLRSKDGSSWDVIPGTETGWKPEHD